LAEVAQQLAARNAGPVLGPPRVQQLFEIAVGELRHDYQLALDDLDAVDGEEKRMANGLDVLNGAELFLGAGAVGFEAIEVTVNKFDGFENPAGREALPDFTESAAAQRFQKFVPRNGFRLRLSEDWHCSAWLGDGLGGTFATGLPQLQP